MKMMVIVAMVLSLWSCATKKSREGSINISESGKIPVETFTPEFNTVYKRINWLGEVYYKEGVDLILVDVRYPKLDLNLKLRAFDMIRSQGEGIEIPVSKTQKIYCKFNVAKEKSEQSFQNFKKRKLARELGYVSLKEEKSTSTYYKEHLFHSGLDKTKVYVRILTENFVALSDSKKVKNLYCLTYGDGMRNTLKMTMKSIIDQL